MNHEDEVKSTKTRKPENEQAPCGQVNAKLGSDSPDDDLLIAHIIDTKSDHEYKIYANGVMTGFPDGCLYLNKFLPLLIRILHDRLPKERLKQLGLGD